MDLVHKKLGVDAKLKEDFTQAEYEAYQNAFVEATKESMASGTVEREIIQAAIDTKILTGFDKVLLEQPPKLVKWLAGKVRNFITEQTEVPQD